MALTNCAECKKQISTEADKCPHCGISNPSVKRRKCPKCKKLILSSADKCTHCGADEPFTIAKTNCRNCKKPVHSMDDTCPHCGVKNPSLGWKQNFFVLVIFIAIIYGIVVWFQDSPEEKEAKRQAQITEQAETARQNAEDRRKGFHCLSAWDGAHNQFEQAVKNRLNDPSSFDHVETRVAPISNGRHNIVMEFRGKNAFGGVVTNIAIGSYSNSNCGEFRIESIE